MTIQKSVLIDDKPFTLYQEAQNAGSKNQACYYRRLYIPEACSLYKEKRPPQDFVSDTVKAYTEI